MSPEASAYVRKRPWMTPELMRKWGCGWIPGNGRSLFRKNYFVYTHRNVRGEVISYSGRDLTFEKKWEQWLRDGKPEGKKPNKHRYVAGYHRGLELYGSMVSRLEEPQLRESLAQNGLVVVEGMNDVIRLDELGICAVGICSNRATETQVESISKFANQIANGRVVLFPDNDPEGEAGFKELLWGLNKHGNNVGLAFRESANPSQPEDIHDWEHLKSLPRSI
jgi:5S rRNA maturation endonuclease (ribonuclease M5)